MTVDLLEAPTLFGKLPARGDFVTSGTRGVAELAFAIWLTRAVEAARGAVPAASVRFVATCADGPTLVGGWIASCDAAGRRFPLVASCRVPVALRAAPAALLLGDCAELEAAIACALAPGHACSAEALDRARLSLTAPSLHALAGLTQGACDTLLRSPVRGLGVRNFARWPLESLAYALTVLQRAAALYGEDLTLDIPASSQCDLFVWLELLYALGHGERPTLLLWAPSLRRALVCLGPCSTDLLMYFNDPRHPSHRRWPLWTDSHQAAITARLELTAELRCCIEQDGTLAALLELVRSRS